MTEREPPQYDHASIEAPLYRRWRDAGLFHAEPDDSRERYVIQMPPPNVTAVLHAGHGLTYTIQDVLIRFERMSGRNTLWLPGTDHAGIATQNVVERQLAAAGKSRTDLGREAFVHEVEAFVATTGGIILKQLEALGAACDWERTYFTLDQARSRSVREAFVRLHEEGLIYRGKYIINWCPRCRTALSNEEVEREETDGRIWRLRYPLADGDDSLVVATTRPETMLGDTAVAVHPKDPRHARFIGREIDLPLTGRRIPVVADAAVEVDFGTGAVKVTPAHDPVDFEIGRRHDLPSIDIMTDDAHMNDAVPEEFRGLDRFEARERVVASFDALGLLEGVESHRHAVGHCYRCHTVVEPRLSDQWFVRMEPLAAPALAAQRDGRVRFIPEHQGDNFAAWLEQIRDWCISRQLWWGHRIPVWYCDNQDCGRITVAREAPADCPDCGGPLRQDEDVLDTWFSSWLVPFSTLGWPDQTDDLAAFYPGNTLVTAPEILFFWVARMIMAGIHFMGEVPFDTVYLHGTVRDTSHRKMSKSLGNGIDPMEVIDRYGADALRYTLVSGMAVGTDVILDPDNIDLSFAPGRNFANKLWNIGRLVFENLADDAPALADVDRTSLTLADLWMLSRTDHAISTATRHYQSFRLNEAAAACHHLLWSELADWYLEAAKPRLYGDGEDARVASAVVAHVFGAALTLLHPVMPFITETLWLKLPGAASDSTLLEAGWPATNPENRSADAESRFEAMRELIGAVRALRAEYGVAPSKLATAVVIDAGPQLSAAIRQESATILRLARLSKLDSRTGEEAMESGATQVLTDGATVVVPVGDLVDLERECRRLGEEATRMADLVERQAKRLADGKFTSRAPAEIVNREREKLALWEGQVAALKSKRNALGCPD